MSGESLRLQRVSLRSDELIQSSVSDSFITRRKWSLWFKPTLEAAVTPSALETDQGHDRPLTKKKSNKKYIYTHTHRRRKGCRDVDLILTRFVRLFARWWKARRVGGKTIFTLSVPKRPVCRKIERMLLLERWRGGRQLQCPNVVQMIYVVLEQVRLWSDFHQKTKRVDKI